MTSPRSPRGVRGPVDVEGLVTDEGRGDPSTSDAIPTSDDHPPAPTTSRRRRTILRDIVVTVVVFVAVVGLAASGLWVRDAVTGRGDRPSGVAGASAMAATPSTPGDPSATPSAPPSVRPSPPPVPVGNGTWVPVVEVLDDDVTDDAAARRAAAVTSLGYPVEVMAGESLVGFEGSGLVLAGVARDSFDEALATCEDRQMVETCQPYEVGG